MHIGLALGINSSLVSNTTPVDLTPPLSDLYTRTDQTFLLGSWPMETVGDFDTWLGRGSDWTAVHAHFDGCDIGWTVYHLQSVLEIPAGVTQVHWSIPPVTTLRRSGDPEPPGGWAGSYGQWAMTQAETGFFDADYAAMAAAVLAKHPAASGPIVIRPAWEFQGGWFPWATGTSEQIATFIAVFQRIVGIFRAASSRFVFEWCPNFPYSAVNIESCYPGDAYVDIIGMDVYYQPGSGTGYGSDFFRWCRDATYGLSWQVSFAAAHGKAWGWSEFGVRDNDAAAVQCVRDMADWLAEHGALFGIYWDSDLAYPGMVSDDGDAARSAAFKGSFAPTVEDTAISWPGDLAFSEPLSAFGTGPLTGWALSANADGFVIDGDNLTLAAQEWEPEFDPAVSTLRWAPPAQTSPNSYSAGTGFYAVTLGDTEDAIITSSAQGNVGSDFEVTGGRHVRLIGVSRRGRITVKNNKGSIYMEGCRVDLSGTTNGRDAINAYGATGYTPDVYIQNCYVTGVKGTNAGGHGDIFQPQGPIGTLYIDKLTGDTNYQGIFIRPEFAISAAYISRIDISFNDLTNPGPDNNTYLLWLRNDLGQSSPGDPLFPVELTDVYLAQHEGHSPARAAVYPYDTDVQGLAAGVDVGIRDGSGNITWIPSAMIAGQATMGAPGSAYVNGASVGVGYTIAGTYQQSLIPDNTRTVTLSAKDSRGISGGSGGLTLTINEPVEDLYPDYDFAFDPVNSLYKVGAWVTDDLAAFLARPEVGFDSDPTAGFSGSGYTPDDDYSLVIDLGASAAWSVYVVADKPATFTAWQFETPLTLNGAGDDDRIEIMRYQESPQRIIGGAKIDSSTVVSEAILATLPDGTFAAGITVGTAGAVKFFAEGSLAHSGTGAAFATTDQISRIRIGSRAGSGSWPGAIRRVLAKRSTDSDAAAEDATGEEIVPLVLSHTGTMAVADRAVGGETWRHAIISTSGTLSRVSGAGTVKARPLAGGGAGGRGFAGGGAAGQLLDEADFVFDASTPAQTITIGAGAPRQTTAATDGTAGGDTVGLGRTAVGGAGGSRNGAVDGNAPGGGAAPGSTAGVHMAGGAAATPGYRGGNGYSNTTTASRAAGGGAGAGGQGGDATFQQSGAGGAAVNLRTWFNLDEDLWVGEGGSGHFYNTASVIAPAHGGGQGGQSSPSVVQAIDATSPGSGGGGSNGAYGSAGAAGAYYLKWRIA